LPSPPRRALHACCHRRLDGRFMRAAIAASIFRFMRAAIAASIFRFMRAWIVSRMCTAAR